MTLEGKQKNKDSFCCTDGMDDLDEVLSCGKINSTPLQSPFLSQQEQADTETENGSILIVYLVTQWITNLQIYDTRSNSQQHQCSTLYTVFLCLYLSGCKAITEQLHCAARLERKGIRRGSVIVPPHNFDQLVHTHRTEKTWLWDIEYWFT